MQLVQALNWFRKVWARDDEASDVDYARLRRLLNDPP